MSTSTLSRRNVVRGAAWTAPLVAVAVAAPAFAASVAPPTIKGTSTGGKCPGQSTDFEWGFIIPVDTTAPVQSLVFTNVIYNGELVADFCQAQVSPTRFAITFDSNSSANGVGGGTFDYTLTYLDGTGVAVVVSDTATFTYNGTHPVDKPTCNAAGGTC